MTPWSFLMAHLCAAAHGWGNTAIEDSKLLWIIMQALTTSPDLGLTARHEHYRFFQRKVLFSLWIVDEFHFSVVWDDSHVSFTEVDVFCLKLLKVLMKMQTHLKFLCLFVFFNCSDDVNNICKVVRTGPPGTELPIAAAVFQRCPRRHASRVKLSRFI